MRRAFALRWYDAHLGARGGASGAADHATTGSVPINVIDDDNQITILFMDRQATALLVAAAECAFSLCLGMRSSRSQCAKTENGERANQQYQRT